MKFSIVITTYNRIALLKRAIDSALKQTIPCEVVVADDASSDQTEDYVR
ncbi:MAG TPA: glycosyl transferase, partial [Planktothrix sp. UBA10369]|nr:glycosyl transferase [Planktothrix sp. UBA10369]